MSTGVMNELIASDQTLQQENISSEFIDQLVKSTEPPLTV